MDLSNAGEVADYFATLPRDMRIVMSSDAEGNSYSPLACAEDGMYSPYNTWSGEIHQMREWVEAKMATPGSGWTEEDLPPADAEHVIVLVPVN